MAGLGRKEFDSGEVLTAADVNGYLMDQSVMRFSNGAARAAAIGTPTEGMVSYNDFTDAVEVYNGTAWVRVGQEGDITAVTAGTALTGGGTAGDVTLNVDETELFTGGAAGGAAYSAGTAGLAFTTAGTAGQILSSTGTAVQWVDQPPAGIEISSTPPSSPSQGDTWWDSDNGKTYIYYDGYWVELQLAEAGSDGALSPNYIINGAFDVWQRGTSSTSSSDGYFTADRWRHNTGGGSVTVSRQPFTAGDIEAIGFGDAEFFLRRASDGSVSNQGIQGRWEDVRLLAGQTATLSFWAKASAAATLRAQPFQNFGSGGSSTVFISAQDSSLTTSWQRFTLTYTIPSVSGKTINSGNYFGLFLITPTATAATVDIWGVQLEAGSVATPFKRNAPSLQGELAACQRYYTRLNYSGGFVATAALRNATDAFGGVHLPVTMRGPVSSSVSGTLLTVFAGSGFQNTTSVFADSDSLHSVQVKAVITGGTAGNAGNFGVSGGDTFYVEASAEL